MTTIGITGGNGFIGGHLSRNIKYKFQDISTIEFDRKYFSNDKKLDAFVSECDVIIHLAALNRHEDENFLHNTNISLVKTLISSLNRTGSKTHVIFSSSSHESSNNLYGDSKKIGRILFSEWASKTGNKFSGILIPNVFGPFGKPYYNSVIATFCHQIVNNEDVSIQDDKSLNLIYIDELVHEIMNLINSGDNTHYLKISPTSTITVSEILELIQNFKQYYILNGHLPELKSNLEKNLFNTFRSYINLENFYPRKYESHLDDRGLFTELIRTETSGQTSFSTTAPEIIRGEHFHTRKIERFAVIKGEALISLRKIGEDKIYKFKLNGNEPSFIDMPIWYTHNLKNIGNEAMYTVFWINEPYNPDDSDTFFEKVDP